MRLTLTSMALIGLLVGCGESKKKQENQPETQVEQPQEPAPPADETPKEEVNQPAPAKDMIKVIFEEDAKFPKVWQYSDWISGWNFAMRLDETSVFQVFKGSYFLGEAKGFVTSEAYSEDEEGNTVLVTFVSDPEKSLYDRVTLQDGFGEGFSFLLDVKTKKITFPKDSIENLTGFIGDANIASSLASAKFAPYDINRRGMFDFIRPENCTLVHDSSQCVAMGFDASVQETFCDQNQPGIQSQSFFGRLEVFRKNNGHWQTSNYPAVYPGRNTNNGTPCRYDFSGQDLYLDVLRAPQSGYPQTGYPQNRSTF